MQPQSEFLTKINSSTTLSRGQSQHKAARLTNRRLRHKNQKSKLKWIARRKDCDKALVSKIKCAPVTTSGWGSSRSKQDWIMLCKRMVWKLLKSRRPMLVRANILNKRVLMCKTLKVKHRMSWLLCANSAAIYMIKRTQVEIKMNLRIPMTTTTQLRHIQVLRRFRFIQESKLR
jgi:hypothetical protein